MDIPRYWRLRNQRYRLEGTVCKECGAKHFPPRVVCPVCRSSHLEPFEFKGAGKVFSYTVVHQAPDIFDKQVPYIVALVELEEGVRLTAQLTDTDLEDVYIGMEVNMVVRKIYEDGENGPIQYGYKFRPRQFAQGQ